MAVLVDGVSLCTGALVAPDRVLTARHCFAAADHHDAPGLTCGVSTFLAPVAADHVAVHLGASLGEHAIAVTRIDLPPSDAFCGADAALLVLADRVEGVTPIGVRLDREASAGEAYAAVGYGVTEDAGAGVRRRRDGMRVACNGEGCASAFIAEGEWLGEDAVCDGDSGGPALDAEGRVFGIASRAKDRCGQPVYESTAALATWLRGVLPRESEAATEDGGCATTRGRSGAAPTLLALALAVLVRRRRPCRRSP